MLGSAIANIFGMMKQSEYHYPKGCPWYGRPQPRNYGIIGVNIWPSSRGTYRRAVHGEIGSSRKK